MPTADSLRDQFVPASRKRDRALKLHAESTAELRQLIPIAAAQGVPISTIAKWSHMTRKAVYEALELAERDGAK